MKNHWQRREFLQAASLAALATALPSQTQAHTTTFPDADPKWLRTWNDALAVLAANIKQVPSFADPVLFEGAVYPGIWQECAPHEGLVYATLRSHIAPKSHRPDPLAIARSNHMAFFALQRPDGQLPASIKLSETGFGQIQMVVPIAATAWELFELNHDETDLHTAYTACSRWDAWLRRYRNTRGTGLVEGFCTYDTGHDNSPRWSGVANRCPDSDAKRWQPNTGVPRLCPDLSATVYGGRIALAKMARALGRPHEAARWADDAETLRRLILAKLYSPQDAAFYDLDLAGNFVRVRSDVLSRVLGEHVLHLDIASDRRIFESIWSRQLHNPDAFWTPYPFPSIALDDPTFVRPIPRNSWGGASQALTALRAPRWMEHYGKSAELRILMRAWLQAIADSGGFRQQMDPLTGRFTLADPSGYSPCALVYLDFARRLGFDPTTAARTLGNLMTILDTEHVDLPTPSGPMRTHILRPSAPGTYPGLILYSEIFQVTAPIRRMAAQLAGHGYIVAVPEVYHEYEPLGTVLAYDQAGSDRGNTLKTTKPLKNYDTDARALLDYLPTRPDCNGRLGVMGICMGGHLAFRAAFNPDVRGTVCFYATDIHKGGLGEGMKDDSLARAAEIHAELLMVWGRQDPHIPTEGRMALLNRLNEAGTRLNWHEVNGAHAFLRDEGVRYDPDLARSMFGLALDLFHRTLAVG